MLMIVLDFSLKLCSTAHSYHQVVTFNLLVFNVFSTYTLYIPYMIRYNFQLAYFCKIQIGIVVKIQSTLLNVNSFV